jgi:hypothetical protein
MNHEEIVRIARENGIDWFRIPGVDQVLIEKFADLIAKNEREKVEAEWRYLMVDVRKVSEQVLEALENVKKYDIEDLYGLGKLTTDFRATLNRGPFARGDW